MTAPNRSDWFNDWFVDLEECQQIETTILQVKKKRAITDLVFLDGKWTPLSLRVGHLRENFIAGDKVLLYINPTIPGCWELQFIQKLQGNEDLYGSGYEDYEE